MSVGLAVNGVRRHSTQTRLVISTGGPLFGPEWRNLLDYWKEFGKALFTFDPIAGRSLHALAPLV
ncbi:MAG: hypothetical protein JJU13_20890 [Balneolaceae bacterium]|nr:hypothetical protein [Balneolaceae bacterium]